MDIKTGPLHPCSMFIFLVFFGVLSILAQQQPQLHQFGSPFGEGLVGLDVSILHDIAVALDPSLQPQQQNGSPWSLPHSGKNQSPSSPTSLGFAPTCSGKDGFFPDYTLDCRIYYRCSPTGRMAKFECPMNYVFSEQLRKCEAPEKVTCGQAKTTTTTTAAPPPLPPIQRKSVLPDFATSLGSGGLSGILSGLPLEGAGGLYEPLLSSATERPILAVDSLLPAVKIMGEPRAALDMDPDLCYGRPSQYLPDADTGCRGYALCPPIFGKAFQSFFCPQGMRFDIKMESCMPKNLVRCMEVERLMPPNTGISFFPSLLPSSFLNPGIGDFFPAVGASPPCFGKTGFVPDTTQNCRVYYYCSVDGSSINLTCQADMVFNPTLQSCDFSQTAPECKSFSARSPFSLPQAIAETTLAPAIQPKTPASAWSYPNPAPRSHMPFQQVAPSNTRPSPGMGMNSNIGAPGNFLTFPSATQKVDSTLPRPRPLESLMPAYGVVRNPDHITNSPHGFNGPLNNPEMLEGFGAPDPFGLPSGIFANRVNTGNPYGKQPDPSPFQLAPRFVGLTAFGSPVTFYETECDGSLNHYIEPDSGCRLYHFCHANMTLETYSCPPGEVYVLHTKSCVSQRLALCLDGMSSDARDILHRTWAATTVAPPPVTTTAAVEITPLPSTAASVIAVQVEPTFRPLVNAAPEPQCANGVTGVFGDSSANCAKYYECHADGRMVTHSCTAQLKFNNKLKACDWPEYLDANCNEIRKTPAR